MEKTRRKVKRVLWVEDIKENPASCLFPSDETNIVGTMDDAIREFSGDRLYMYDTIVLDIDFENGLGDPEYVIQKLSEKIYLSKDQLKDNAYIINNGGYLLFLYLLERGYPSSQIAFLTGNAGIISQLKAFHDRYSNEMTKDDIAAAILTAWKEAGGENAEGEWNVDFDSFEAKIRQLPIDAKYKDGDFYEQCEDILLEDSGEKEVDPRANKLKDLKELVNTVPTDTPIETVENTGDKIIFRFHDANLEAPSYFSKNENDIGGHNRADAEDWLDHQRTNENLLRWLLLAAGDYVEGLFRADSSEMNTQIKTIMRNVNDDGGVRSAFRQMYFVFDGLRAVEHKGVYYQAVSAMLIPFEGAPQSAGDYVFSTDYETQPEKFWDTIRRMFTCCSKQARNYCAHNSMGTTLSVETTLFLLMLSLSAILNRDQREEMGGWYQKAAELINKKFYKEDIEVDLCGKIQDLVEELSSRGVITEFEEVDQSADGTIRPRSILYKMGKNSEIDKSNVANVETREDYYVFSIAAYILGWFDNAAVDEVKKMYDQPVAYVYETAQNIVNAYEYPFIAEQVEAEGSGPAAFS